MKIKLYYGWKESFGEQELTVWNTDYVSERNGYAGCGSFEIEADIQAPSHEETINAKVKRRACLFIKNGMPLTITLIRTVVPASNQFINELVLLRLSATSFKTKIMLFN